jgi:hypothetical protein
MDTSSKKKKSGLSDYKKVENEIAKVLVGSEKTWKRWHRRNDDLS